MKEYTMKNILLLALSSVSCLLFTACQLNNEADSITIKMINEFKNECIKHNRFFSEKVQSTQNGDMEIDTIYYHLHIAADGFAIDASNKEYYYDLTPPPPTPPASAYMLDCIPPEDSDSTYNSDKEIPYDSAAWALYNEEYSKYEELIKTYKYYVFRLKSSNRNVILYASDLADAEKLKQLASPLELTDISDYARKFSKENPQDNWFEIFAHIACFYEVDSIGRIELKKIQHIE